MMDVKVEIPQWIPASEKMPEEYAFGDYWVTVLRYDGSKDTIVSEWGLWGKVEQMNPIGLLTGLFAQVVMEM